MSMINDETGARIAALGFFLALFGAALAFTFLPVGGYWIAVAGVVLGLAGIALHFVLHRQAIFRIKK
ncbi:hypothetical protein [Variovorax sp. EL159]|uniref:hypothetical protein n=1 Tax=Variovorax sp. EL159 TaxID=1566270 RepID=UPI000B877298|nr:hypothetical protein [Variovorax sp. EL159]